MERVVPLAVKVGVRNAEVVHVSVGHNDAGRVAPAIKLGRRAGAMSRGEFLEWLFGRNPPSSASLTWYGTCVLF